MQAEWADEALRSQWRRQDWIWRLALAAIALALVVGVLSAYWQAQRGKMFKEAIAHGDVATVARLVRGGVNQKQLSQGVWDCLIQASKSRWEHTKVLDALVKNGANLSGVAGEITPLQFAVSANDIEAVHWLLTNGANPNVIGKDGTALRWAILETNRSACIQDLLTFGAKLDSATLRGITLTDAINAGVPEVVQELIQKGADPRKLKDGVPPLYRCLSNDDARTAKVLLNSGIDANAPLFGQPPLGMALDLQKWNVARELVLHGADVNARYQGSLKPLYLARRFGSKQSDAALIQLMRARGAKE